MPSGSGSLPSSDPMWRSNSFNVVRSPAARLEVESNPASDLLVLDSGALVPVVFVTGHAPGHVTIDPPEGLFDL